MIDKIKALPDKTLVIIGVALIFIAIIFLFATVFANGMAFNRWIDFIFYFLCANGFAFIMMAYKKKINNK